MKRFLFLCMTVIVAVAVNAQCYIGGTFGLGASRVSIDGEGDTSVALSIVPEFGYQINKTFTIGAMLGISHTSAGADVTQLSLIPFGRATFAHVKIVDFFADLQLAYNHAWIEDYSADGFGIGIYPGIKIKVSQNLDLLARTTLLQYEHMDDVNTVGFSIGGAFNFGIAYNF